LGAGLLRLFALPQYAAFAARSESQKESANTPTVACQYRYGSAPSQAVAEYKVATLKPANLEKSFEKAADLVKSADALIIAAGAGMGVDSGLPDFRGAGGFWRAYPALAEAQISFSAIACYVRQHLRIGTPVLSQVF